MNIKSKQNIKFNFKDFIYKSYKINYKQFLKLSEIEQNHLKDSFFARAYVKKKNGEVHCLVDTGRE